MPEPFLSDRDRLYCMMALVAALSVVALTSSLTWPILAEALRGQGYGETMIGLNAAAQFSGIILVALNATWIIPRFGFFKTILCGLALVAAMLLALPVSRDFHLWFALRFLLGIGNSLLFTAGDTWINQIVEDRVRGRWMGFYGTVSMAGWAVGPIIGSVMDPESFWPFLIGVSAIVIATGLLIPTWRIDITLSRGPEAESHRGKLLLVFVAAPTVLLSSGMFGFVEGGLQSFAHLYTMDVLGAEYRSTGYAVIWVGSVVAIFFQYPVGWLADKVDRGWLLVGCVAIMAISIALLPVLIDAGTSPWWSPRALLLWTTVSLWGGAMGATFTVGITLLGERFRAVELVAANAVFSLLFGIGGVVGPFVVGSAMGHFGPGGFPASLAIAVFAYLLFAGYRQATRRRRVVAGS